MPFPNSWESGFLLARESLKNRFHHEAVSSTGSLCGVDGLHGKQRVRQQRFCGQVEEAIFVPADDNSDLRIKEEGLQAWKQALGRLLQSWSEAPIQLQEVSDAIHNPNAIAAYRLTVSYPFPGATATPVF